ESSALPLSYAGKLTKVLAFNKRTKRTRYLTTCPGTDSNRDALRHHPLKMACLPISPPGPCGLLQFCDQRSAIRSKRSENRNDRAQTDSKLLSLVTVLHGSDGARTRDLSSDSRVL